MIKGVFMKIFLWKASATFIFFYFALSTSSALAANECLKWTSNQTHGIWLDDSASTVGAICAVYTQQIQQSESCVFSVKSCNVTHRTFYYNDPNRPQDHVLFIASKKCGSTQYGDIEWLSTAQAVPCTYKAGAPEEENPPQACVGNPIDAASGKKHQHETDINSLGQGQIEFLRIYSKSLSPWRHNYQRSLVAIDSSQTTIQLKLSADYGTNKANACSSGWTELQDRNAGLRVLNSTSVLSADGEVCDIKKNGKVVKRLPLVSDKYYKKITLIPGLVRLERPDGSILVMYQKGNIWRALGSDTGFVERQSDSFAVWRFTTSTGTLEDYNADGKLLSITTSNGMRQELFYDIASGLLSSVKDSTGRELLFAYTGNQINSVTVDGNKTTSYTYNALGLITQVTRPDNTTRIYHYEDTRFPTSLTGITDERSARYATWTYDAQGRAISSEHAGGAEKTLLAFNTDGSTTVTNALNKQTIYRFDDIAGARRVTKVEGQPTANCIGANQDYTYTPEGWIASKTDWKGIKTTFTYNTAGQEISRTEAFGTPEARTTTTEWHPTLFVKTKITEPEKETVYSYDANGRLLNQSTQSISVQ
jgi:YD repeat-containing protein